MSVDGPRIRVLPDDLANQIAAGEVVERPASAAKELVENALDAGARRIAIDVAAGGLDLVRVADDGCGMSRADAVLCLQRHATSKIASLDDLRAIQTFGFRGEALPSIASVSRFVLQTRHRDDDEGTEVRLEGGGPVEPRPCGCATGTVVEVRDLFFNVPARRKFLRGQQTEAAHVTETALAAALANPTVTVVLTRDGRKAREWLRASGREERVRGAFAEEQLAPCRGQRGPLAVEAFLSRPERARAGATGLLLFVNGRPVRDRTLARAVAQAYGSVLEPGRYPLGAVFLELPPELVDVNAHPQKSEVRFADGRAVADALHRIVSAELAGAFGIAAPGARWQKRPPLFDEPPPAALAPWAWSTQPAGAPAVAPAGAAPDRAAPDRAAPAAAETGSRPAALDEGGRMDLPAGKPMNRQKEPGPAGPAAPPTSYEVGSDAIPGMRATYPHAKEGLAHGGIAEPGALSPPSIVPNVVPVTLPAPPEYPAAAELARPFARAAVVPRLRFLAQSRATFLVCEGPDGLYVLDQHAAAERVTFDRLRRAYEASAVASQKLLFPVVVPASPSDVEVIEEARDAVARMGLEVSAAGPGSIAVHAVPQILSRAPPERLVRDLLDELGRTGGRAFSGAVDLALATMACHGSVRAGDTVSAEEASALLVALDGVDFAGHCPHGRPIVMRTSWTELEQRVGRK